jgi:hypothetical protein
VVGGAPKPAANGDLFKHFPRGTVKINKKNASHEDGKLAHLMGMATGV